MSILTGLTAAKISRLSVAQIRSLTTSDIAGLTAAQLPGLTASELELFSAAQLAGLGKAQIGYLSASAIAGWTPAQIALLAPAQIGGFTVSQIGALSLTQLAAFSAADIAALNITQIAALTPVQLASLKPAQFAGLSAADLAGLSLTQIKALTPAQLAVFTATQLRGLSAADISALSAAQIAGLNPDVISALTPAQMKALTAAQVAALTSAQIGQLTAAQLQGLTAIQFGALTGAQIGALTAADIRALSAGQLAGMSGAQIAGLSASQINALGPGQLASLDINYNSMLAILDADAVGGMTAAKFGALQALVGKFNIPGGIQVSAYVQQISDDVVLGNVANATWTGGGQYAAALGNLTAASSESQVNELIGKWFLGTDLPSSSVSLNGEPNFSVSYTPVAEPLFASGGLKMSDVNQGYLGDCYVLAPLAEMAAQDPSAIPSMIAANGNDTYSVRFSLDGKDDYVTVNSQLADDGAIFNHGPDIWAGLIEKAYAQLQASGTLTGDDFTFGNSFSSIGNGGAPEMTLEEMTDSPTITDFDAKATSWSSYIYDGASLSVPNGADSVVLQSSQNKLSNAAVQAALVADLTAGDDLILSSLTDATDKSGNTTLVADHAMAVYGFDVATKMFEIYNPWGTASGALQSWDTSFEIGLGTLLSDGDTISVAANAPATSLAGSTTPPLLGKTSQSDALGLAAAPG